MLNEANYLMDIPSISIDNGGKLLAHQYSY
jgi:hypothetical protein